MSNLRVCAVQFKASDSPSLFELQRLLLCTSDVYKSLAKTAAEGKIPIPEEAQLGGTTANAGRGPLVWDEFAAAGAADWDDFQDEGPHQHPTLGPQAVCVGFQHAHAPVGMHSESL